MNDYKPNSHKYKNENKSEKKIEKIVKGTVKTRKKSGISKLTGELISEDANNVGSYIFEEVLVPTIKNAIVNIVTDGINMIFFGGTRRSDSSSRTSSYVSYGSYSDRDRFRSSGSSRRTAYSHDDVILESRGEAEEVLDRMDELIATYGVVSIADMYDLIGKSCAYTDNKYGWTNIRNAEPIRTRDGWMLKLPKALPIE